MKALVLVLTSIFFAPITDYAQSADASPAPKKIKILSWNIYMLPGFLGHGKKPRAEAIGQLLASSDYDVVVFQEAFHGNARKILSRLLQPAFPFQTGPANQKAFSLRTNSGIWIISKHPILLSHAMIFKTRHGIDALSRKGALLAEVRVDGQTIQVVGTHLQNSGGDWRRYSQCVELYNRMLKKYERLGVAQIVCGDFNINRYRSQPEYDYMLGVLQAVDGLTLGPQAFSYDRISNDLTTERGEGQDLIDYVLLRQIDGLLGAGERKIRVLQYPWNAGHKDLSDHFAVEAVIPLQGAQAIVAASNHE